MKTTALLTLLALALFACGTPAPAPQPMPEPPPTPTLETLTYQLYDPCSSLGAVNYRFFDKTSGQIWPNASQYDRIQPGTVQTQNLSCLSGDTICYGATTADGATDWGVALDGSRTCSGCCAACATTLVAVTFGCR